MNPTADTRDTLRSAILGRSHTFRREKVINDDGVVFEVVQPSIRQRADLRKKTTTISADGIQFDMFEFMIQAAIQFTVVPGTDEKIFTAEDYDVLASYPSGGFVDRLCEAASKLCNIEDEAEKKP